MTSRIEKFKRAVNPEYSKSSNLTDRIIDDYIAQESKRRKPLDEAVETLFNVAEAIVYRYDTSLSNHSGASDLMRGVSHGNYGLIKDALAQLDQALAQVLGE